MIDAILVAVCHKEQKPKDFRILLSIQLITQTIQTESIHIIPIWDIAEKFPQGH